LVNKYFRGKVKSVINDTDGRRIMINIDDNGILYTVVNVYCPNTVYDRIHFLDESAKWIQDNMTQGSKLVIGGDVNCIDWPNDKTSLECDQSSESFRNMKSTCNVRDAWKIMNPDTVEYTYIDPSFRDRNSRIDVLCIDEILLDNLQYCDHILAPCPDHKAVVMAIRCSNKKRGNGYWKLNTSVLTEDKYRKAIRDIIKNTIEEYQGIEGVDKGMIWELLKIRVKEFSIKYCCQRSKDSKIEMKILESQITQLDKQLQCNGNDEELIRQRRFRKEQLDQFYLNKGIGAQIRSKVQWVEEGERSTSYFLAIEKHRQGNNVIKSLKDHGITLSDDIDILNKAREFYNELYTSNMPHSNDIDTYMSNIDIPSLKHEKRTLCEGDILLTECENAINRIKNNKSPGDDGLPIEFYKTFWNEISDFIVDVYNESYDNNIMPISMRKSIITLIHKKGDRCDISNYRPVSLTNVDYRILAFVLASRLQLVISDIVDPSQVAYIKGRFIGANVRLVCDIFDLYNEKQLSGIMLFADFQKAFDTIEWDFLFKTLDKFNFGESFQRWIKILYTNPNAAVKNNGHFSDEFVLSRGVRQGCPVSALLFILCMEVLACNIRQNNEITGLSLDANRTTTMKMVQYADDSTFFVKNSHELGKVIESLELFGNVSGTKLNLLKCEGLWLGRNRNRQHNCTLYNIKWPRTSIRYLGIYIGHNAQQNYKLNFEAKLSEIDDVLRQAEKRILTLFGKVCIIKSLAISKIVYVATCLCIPENVVKEIDQRIFKFLWGKRDRVKRKSIINSLENGGLSMVDIRSQFSAIKASWACRIMNAPDDHLWSYLPKWYISKFGSDFLILKTSVTKNTAFDALKTMPEFYRQVVFSYNSSKVIDYADFCANMKTQPIWGNKYITHNNRTLFFKSWVRAGIIRIENLRMHNGRLDCYFLGDKIQDYRNFYSEVNMLQDALRKVNILGSFEPTNDIVLPKYIHHKDEFYEWECTRARYFYTNIIESVKTRPTAEQYWIDKTGVSEDDIHQAYMCKIKMIRDKKLAETYFKILNNILPCNKNLYKWGKTNSQLCYFCNEDETISHLLFDCTYAKQVWRLVSDCLLHSEITLNMVLFGKGLGVAMNYIFSLSAYYIYKEFLIPSLEGRDRKHFSIASFVNYLEIRKNVYINCSSNVWKDVCVLIDDLLKTILQN